MAENGDQFSERFLHMTELEASNYVFDLTEGMFRTQALFVVTDLGIPDIVLKSSEPVSMEYIVSQIAQDVDIGVLRRVMRYISAHGVFTESQSAEGALRFGPTKVTEQLSLSHPFSGTCTSWACGRLDIGISLMNLHRVVKKEINPESDLYREVHGKSVWENLAGDASASSKFQLAMKVAVARNLNVIPYLAMEIEDGSTVMDVGGGTGAMMGFLYEKRPHITCINMDLAKVIDLASPIKGVQMVAGDMFDVSTLPKSDVIFMKYILHDWKDDKCLDILCNCHAALSTGGKLITVGISLPEGGHVNKCNKNTLQVDLMMLAHFGSRERTAKELKNMFSSTGFCLDKVIPIEQGTYGYWPLTMLVSHKI